MTQLSELIVACGQTGPMGLKKAKAMCGGCEACYALTCKFDGAVLETVDNCTIIGKHKLSMKDDKTWRANQWDLNCDDCDTNPNCSCKNFVTYMKPKMTAEMAMKLGKEAAEEDTTTTTSSTTAAAAVAASEEKSNATNATPAEASNATNTSTTTAAPVVTANDTNATATAENATANATAPSPNIWSIKISSPLKNLRVSNLTAEKKIFWTNKTTEILEKHFNLAPGCCVRNITFETGSVVVTASILKPGSKLSIAQAKLAAESFNTEVLQKDQDQKIKDCSLELLDFTGPDVEEKEKPNTWKIRITSPEKNLKLTNITDDKRAKWEKKTTQILESQFNLTAGCCAKNFVWGNGSIVIGVDISNAGAGNFTQAQAKGAVELFNTEVLKKDEDEKISACSAELKIFSGPNIPASETVKEKNTWRVRITSPEGNLKISNLTEEKANDWKNRTTQILEQQFGLTPGCCVKNVELIPGSIIVSADIIKPGVKLELEKAKAAADMFAAEVLAKDDDEKIKACTIEMQSFTGPDVSVTDAVAQPDIVKPNVWKIKVSSPEKNLQVSNLTDEKKAYWTKQTTQILEQQFNLAPGCCVKNVGFKTGSVIISADIIKPGVKLEWAQAKAASEAFNEILKNDPDNAKMTECRADLYDISGPDVVGKPNTWKIRITSPEKNLKLSNITEEKQAAWSKKTKQILEQQFNLTANCCIKQVEFLPGSIVIRVNILQPGVNLTLEGAQKAAEQFNKEVLKKDDDEKLAACSGELKKFKGPQIPDAETMEEKNSWKIRISSPEKNLRLSNITSEQKAKWANKTVQILEQQFELKPGCCVKNVVFLSGSIIVGADIVKPGQRLTLAQAKAAADTFAIEVLQKDDDEKIKACTLGLHTFTGPDVPTQDSYTEPEKPNKWKVRVTSPDKNLSLRNLTAEKQLSWVNRTTSILEQNFGLEKGCCVKNVTLSPGSVIVSADIVKPGLKLSIAKATAAAEMFSKDVVKADDDPKIASCVVKLMGLEGPDVAESEKTNDNTTNTTSEENKTNATVNETKANVTSNATSVPKANVTSNATNTTNTSTTTSEPKDEDPPIPIPGINSPKADGKGSGVTEDGSKSNSGNSTELPEPRWDEPEEPKHDASGGSGSSFVGLETDTTETFLDQ